MEIIIKQTTDKDSALVIAKSLPDYFNDSGIKQIEESLEKELLFGSYVDDQMVGFVTYKEESQQVIELSWTGVLSEFQGKGIGTKLINESLKKINNSYKVCKVKTLADTVDDAGYSKTRNFWQKLGFIPIEVIDPYPGWEPGNPCVIMIRQI